MSPLLRTVPLAALAIIQSCSGPSLEWHGAGPEDPDPSGLQYLRDYKESHYRELGSAFTKPLDWEAFERELDGKSVLYLGDHHQDEPLHDSMLAVVMRLARQRKIALGLEAIGVQDEPAVARFLGQDCELDELRRSIRDRWNRSWLDHSEVDAGFYRALLRVAREESLPVFALEPTPRMPLDARDAYIAQRIRSAHELLPSRLIVVIVGHAHLLGAGQLVERTGLPSLAVGARLSRTLRSRLLKARPTRSRFLRSDAGVLFFNPPPETL